MPCCAAGHREQLNQLTAYIDGSFMYGSDSCTAQSLRSLRGGRLNVTRHPAGRGLKPLLPLVGDHPECKAPSGLCFFAGEYRWYRKPNASYSLPPNRIGRTMTLFADQCITTLSDAMHYFVNDVCINLCIHKLLTK